MSFSEWDEDRPLDDWEYPDGEDDDLAESTPLRECPHCGADVFDDAVACPKCGEYFTRATDLNSLPVWMKIAAIAAVIGMLTALGLCI